MLLAEGLTNFFNGTTERIDSDLCIDMQASYLPYDQKFEFQREKLEFGELLGEGAFGVGF